MMDGTVTRAGLAPIAAGLLAGAGLVFAVPDRLIGAQRPDLGELLRRAETYVAKYLAVFSDVVADEHYVQDLQSRVPGSRSPDVHRELRSELVLVSVSSPLGWRPFRDVYEVDGKPVRDRDARLRALFSGGAAGPRTLEQAMRIAQESARYNIGPVHRTLNVPGLPMLFLQASLRQRFEFSLDQADREMSGTWIVKFQERARPTLFRGDRNADNASSGRLWIGMDTGAIRRTEHVLWQGSLTATFLTDFGPSDRFGVDVPMRLRENTATVFRGSSLPATRLSGIATYSNLTKLGVSVDVVPGGRPSPSP